jgi:hypothetical protein
VPSQGWLLITVSTAGASSTLRVHVWRKLRGLGAHYLQQSVCLLPDRPEVVRAVARVTARVQREGGQARALPIAISDPDDEQAVIGAFCAERSDEYAEVSSRVPAFLAEIDDERTKGRATYTEVEESEADLARLRGWLAKIEARDYFDAPGRVEATAAVDRCAQVLAEFELEALTAETARGQDPSPGRR